MNLYLVVVAASKWVWASSKCVPVFALSADFVTRSKQKTKNQKSKMKDAHAHTTEQYPFVNH